MKFFALDGSGFLYRAYYAFPHLPNTEGRNLNVVYGFFRMLLKILSEKPQYFALAWDSPVKTHRHEAFPEYKATRKKMEDDFKQQIPLVQEIVAELGLSALCVAGYEADDILATLAHKLPAPDLDICIYSADKDLKQLLNEHVFCIDPMKQLTSTVASFHQEFGFAPARMLDYLSLLGDSSDNIPGVPGIGPKKASDLVQKYGDLDAIYAHLDELTPDLRALLEAEKVLAYKSRDLVQLQDVPDMPCDLSSFSFQFHLDRWKEVLVHRHHFASMEKPIDDLKRSLTMPVQNSLF